MKLNRKSRNGVCSISLLLRIFHKFILRKTGFGNCNNSDSILFYSILICQIILKCPKTNHHMSGMVSNVEYCFVQIEKGTLMSHTFMQKLFCHLDFVVTLFKIVWCSVICVRVDRISRMCTAWGATSTQRNYSQTTNETSCVVWKSSWQRRSWFICNCVHHQNHHLPLLYAIVCGEMKTVAGGTQGVELCVCYMVQSCRTEHFSIQRCQPLASTFYWPSDIEYSKGGWIIHAVFDIEFH